MVLVGVFASWGCEGKAPAGGAMAGVEEEVGGSGAASWGSDLGASGRRAAASEVLVCEGAACCPEGLTVEEGTEGADVFVGPGDGRCFVGHGGADVVVALGGGETAAVGGEGADVLQVTGPATSRLVGGEGNDVVSGGGGADEMHGGDGSDLLQGGGGSDVLWGGAGEDLLLGGGGADEVYGGDGADDVSGGVGADRLAGGYGDDVLLGGPGGDVLSGSHGADLLFGDGGADVLEPGPGADLVSGGPGDDEVRVYDVCELGAGKVLLGGPGHDVLVLPVPLSEAEAVGVVVSGFEEVVVAPAPEVSVCGKCGCALDGGAVTCCSGVGTCDLGNDENEEVVCDCPEGLAGNDCSYDPSETFETHDVPDWCDESKPSCFFTYDADDATGFVDLSEADACIDLPVLQLEGAPESIEWILMHPTFPDQAGTWAEGTFPVVLFGPGNGFSTAEYSEVAFHLARNGYIVVVAGPPGNYGSVALRAEMLVCIRRLLSEIVAAGSSVADHWDTSYAYMGHSRGGEAAAMAAGLDASREESQQGGMEEPGAVVAFAPTAQCARKIGSACRGISKGNVAAMYETAVQQGGDALALLLLEGSRDGDAPGESATLVDTFAPEAADGSDPPPETPRKVVHWLFGASHKSWLTGGPLGAGRGYGRLFLDAHVRGSAVDRDLLTGRTVLPCLADPAGCDAPFEAPKQVFTMYREGGTQVEGRRRVIRQFQLDLPLPEGIGRAIVESGSVRRVLLTQAGASEEDHWPPEVRRLQPQRIRGSMALVDTVEPSPGQDVVPARLRLELTGHDVESPTPFDAISAQVDTLSFRALLLPGKDASEQLGLEACQEMAAEEALRTLHVRARLEDTEGGASPDLDSADYAVIRPPDVAWNPIISNAAATCEATGFWTTVRIPLSDFSGVDFRKLSKLLLEVRPADHGGERLQLLLDTVEFVGYDEDAGGLCGDGIAAGSEACDGTDLRGEDCQSQGFDDGILKCAPDCTLDTSGCQQICAFGDPGDLGCPCAPVGEQLCPADSVEEEGCHPDGPGSYSVLVYGDQTTDQGLYCKSAQLTSGVAVCSLGEVDGAVEDVCIACPDEGTGGYGCPCSTTAECEAFGTAIDGTQVPLYCFGSTMQGWAGTQTPRSGRCLPDVDPNVPYLTNGGGPASEAWRDEFERTSWLCKQNCKAIGAALNRESAYECWFNQTFEFHVATCVDTVVAGLEPCELTGRRYDPALDLCRDECDPSASLEEQGQQCQYWGYPPSWACAGWVAPPRCAPGPCRTLPLAPSLDITECKQFMTNGGEG